MSREIIEERLKNYALKTIEDEEHALKEILQEVALYALANANFFEKAAFCGGTALRILYGLPRFSEDLDFILQEPDKLFRWNVYIDSMLETLKKFGIVPEVKDKSDTGSIVKKMFLKDDSIGKIISLSFKHHPSKKLAIKFELDTNPPSGSVQALKFVEFPYDFSVVSQDLPSCFAGKCHALLARKFIKGRDWYDFLWYVKNRISPNLLFLESALSQQGPWEGSGVVVTPHWFIEAMHKKIETIDWAIAAQDVETFLNQEDRKTLALWSQAFFLDKLNKLATIMKS